jgi:hypothetical protein
VDLTSYFYVTWKAGDGFVGLYTLGEIDRMLAAGELQESHYAAESDGRSFSQFRKTGAGRWRTLAELFTEQLVIDAVASQRAQRSANLTAAAGAAHDPPVPGPAGEGCPCCGSTAFTRVKPVKGTALTADRQCKACGTRYLTIRAPVSGAMQAAMYSSGVVLILGGVLAAVLQLAAIQGPGGPRLPFQLYGIIFSFMLAFRLFRQPHQVQEQREMRWQDYKASAPPDAPPPVGLSSPPDAVSISILFGGLSLMAPLISSLLTVVVFGPAALISGAVAMTAGHTKGLLGFFLGVAGLTVWGLVLFFLVQHAM